MVVNYNEIEEDDLIEEKCFDTFKDNAIKSYLEKFNKYPLLTSDEEKQLFQEYKKNGSKEARKTLIEHNLKLVLYIVKCFYTNDDSFLDLIEEGNIGLIKAIEKFDPDKNCKFSTYAYFWIKSFIMNYINTTEKNLSVSDSRKYIEYIKEKEALIQKFKRNLSYQELSEFLDMPLKKIYMLENFGKITPISINSYILEESTTLESIIPDTSIKIEEDFIGEDFRKIVKNYILNCNIISERQKEILLKRFGFEDNKIYTCKELEKIYGVKYQRISQLEKRALQKIKEDPIFLNLIFQSERIEYKVSPIDSYFPNNSLEEINKSIKYLKKTEIKFLKYFYKEYNVNKVNNCSKYDINVFNNILIKLKDILDSPILILTKKTEVN